MVRRIPARHRRLIVESYAYDGFGRIAEHTSMDETGASESTSYSYDAMDRTTSRISMAGAADEETTDFSYLGLSGEVLNEEIAGEVQKSYQYSPWGQRLSQVKHNSDGTSEDGFYGYNPHTDVETVTDDTGNTTSTYGYTAYGKDDEAEFTGVDAPDAGEPGAEPYNVYRYNSKRWDGATGTYDMGFRAYSPGLNRFLSRDMYSGALADLNLTTSPWNNNRYAFTSGNPITGIELDGHRPIGPTDTAQGDRELYDRYSITSGGWRVDQYGGWEYTETYSATFSDGGWAWDTTTARSKEAIDATGGPALTRAGAHSSSSGVSSAEQIAGAAVGMLPIIGTAGDGIDCVKGRTEGCLGLATLGIFRAAGAAATAIRSIRHADDAAKSVPNPKPVLKSNGAPDRSSPWYVSYRDADGNLQTVGNLDGVHAEVRIQQMQPGAPMSKPFGWRTRDSAIGPEWVEGTVCAGCQVFPRGLFAPGTRGAPGGPWGD